MTLKAPRSTDAKVCRLHIAASIYFVLLIKQSLGTKLNEFGHKFNSCVFVHVTDGSVNFLSVLENHHVRNAHNLHL